MKFKLFFFRSPPRENVFAPVWDYPISEDMITTIDFKTLATLILKKEKELLCNKNVEIKSDGYTGLGKNSLTARYKYYNLLDIVHPEIQKLKKAILTAHQTFLTALKIPLYPQLYIQCWANVMRKGEQIKAHIHRVDPHAYLGGHIVVQAQGTQTHYINPVNQINEPALYSSKNTIGKISLFPNCIPHYTDVQRSPIWTRITIAFDLLVNKNVAHHNYRRII